MKMYITTAFKDGELVFSFSVNAYNSYQAIKFISEDELMRDMEFDKLIIKELKE